jgi:hypothetical protein
MALFTYDDTSIREDLLSILRDVSPAASNYLVTNLAKSTALSTRHQWVIRNIGRYTSDQSVAEGADFSEPAGDAPTRSENYTATIALGVKVSGTQNAVNRALPGNAFDDEKKIKLMRLKAAMEWVLLNGSKVSGASGTARTTAGINNVISTNLTFAGSAMSMSTTELENILQNSWDAVGDGFVADIVLCPMGIKRKIAGFTTGVTRYTDEPDHIYNNVAVYESSAGVHKIIPHKDVISGTATTHVYALREDTFKMAFLKGREPFWNALPPSGDNERGQYITEFTLESLAERASVKRYGYAVLG